MTDRVRIGTCAGPAEAAFVRSVFAAHDLHVVIGGENHASMFAGLGGFISLDIIVAEEDAEEAVALLRDIREGDHAVADGEAPEPEADEHDDEHDDELADAQGVWGRRADKPAIDGPVQEAPFDDRRRRIGIALVVGVMLGVGAGHMYTRAWLRGILLLGLQILGVTYLFTAPSFAALLIVGTRIYDPVGAIWRIWAGTSPSESRRDHGVGRLGPAPAAAAAPRERATVAGEDHATAPIDDPGPT